MLERSDGAWYIISVAAQKAEVHEQTLRHYERLGLISPARKGARVEAILHMKDRMEQMQVALDQEIEQMREQHANETRRLKDIIERLQRGAGA